MGMLTRRKLIEWLGTAATIAAAPPAWFLSKPSIAMAEQQMAFTWRVPVAHLEQVKQELQYEGQVEREQDQKGLTAVFIISGLVLLPYLAKAVLALRRSMTYGGIVIDMRGPKVAVDTDKSLPASMILVIDADGKHTLYESSEISDPSQLVGVLMSKQ
jgi:hypothetical protein